MFFSGKSPTEFYREGYQDGRSDWYQIGYQEGVKRGQHLASSFFVEQCHVYLTECEKDNIDDEGKVIS